MSAEHLGDSTHDYSHAIDQAILAFDTLLPVAAYVADMPFETPLRWQQVHDLDPITQGPGSVLSTYLMVDAGQERQVTLYPNARDDVAWSLQATRPDPDGGHKKQTIEVIERTDGSFDAETRKYTFFGKFDSTTPTTTEQIQFVTDLIDEVRRTGHERQFEFVSQLEDERADGPVHCAPLSTLVYTDFRDLNALSGQIASHRPTDAQLFSSVLAIIESDDAEIIVARDRIHRIVGSVVVNLARKMTRTEGHIDDLVVLADARGAGIGDLLMAYAEETLALLGAEKAVLTSRISRVGARRLYTKRGFALRDTGVFEKPLNTDGN